MSCPSFSRSTYSNVSTTLLDIEFASVDFIWLSATQPAPGEDVSQYTSIKVDVHLLSSFIPQPQISALVSQAATMQQDIKEAAARCTALEQWMTTLQSESETLLTQDAVPAMDALIVLVNRIESLHQITQGQNASSLMTYRDPTSAFGAIQVRAPLVNACKSQSQVVFGHFRSLSEKASNLTQKFTEVRTVTTNLFIIQ
jgi:hypothetical protein